MELEGVRLEVPAQAPVMMLRETVAPHRILPIYIGSPEAAAIHYALEGIEPARPLTHDLLESVIDALGAELEHVIVTEVREHTYFAELHLSANGESIVISCRPSDAVALAVRVGCEIFATAEVLAAGGRIETPPDETGESAEEEQQILAEFQDFIASVTPEDFAE
jgi:bifunctional DNase/RNase